MDLVCHLSSFFKAALSRGFKEAEEKRVTLKEDDPAVFQVFVVWLYTGEIKQLKTWGDLLQLAWILGDKLGAPAFQNCAMIKLITPSGAFPWHPQIVEHVYNNTTEGSLLRAASVDSIFLYRGEIKDRDAEWMALLSRGGDFVVDLMKIFLKWDKLKDARLVQDKYLVKE